MHKLILIFIVIFGFATGTTVAANTANQLPRKAPEMAMIDKKGQIRFQNFGIFEPKDGEHIIRTLLKE